MDERKAIDALRQALTQAAEGIDATPGCRTIAALKLAAGYANSTDMPPDLATAMLSTFMRGQ